MRSWPIKGSIINIQAYKYDGTLYRQWNGVKVLDITKDYLVLTFIKTKILELENDKKWVSKEPTIIFMPFKSFYNVFILHRKNENYVYINLSSSPIYEDKTIKFIDFDLDVKISNGKFLVVDKRDFAKNKVALNYPLEIESILNEEIAYIKQIYKKNEFVFDTNLIDKYVDEINDLKLLRKICSNHSPMIKKE